MKDAKGHGSDSRGGALGFWAHSIPAASGVEHVASIARAHGISGGGPFKVQALNTKLVGNPWGTQKRFGNKTVAETVAQHMRQDGGYTRVR